MIKPGALCRVIGGVDGINVGKIVRVSHLAGFHEQFGPIWTAISVDGDIVTEYGGVTPDADFAAEWLEVLPPEEPKTKVDEKELEKV